MVRELGENKIETRLLQLVLNALFEDLEAAQDYDFFRQSIVC